MQIEGVCPELRLHLLHARILWLASAWLWLCGYVLCASC